MKHHVEPVTQAGFFMSDDGANVLPSEPRHDRALKGERSRRWAAVPVSYQSLSSLVATLDVTWIMALSVTSGLAYHVVASDGPGDIGAYMGCGLVVTALFCMSASACDLYKPSSLRMPEIRKTLAIWIMVLLCLVTVAFTLKISHMFSRGATLLFFVGGMVGIVATRVGIARILTRLMSARALAGPRVIVLADADWRSQDDLVTTFGRYGYTVVRIFDVGGDAKGEFSERTAERIRQVVRYARANDLNEIILAIPWGKTALIDGIAKELRMLPYPAKLAADPIVDRFLTRPLLELGPAKAVELLPAPFTAAQRAMKRTLDLIGAGIGLVALAPVFALMAAAIRLDSSGPVLFMQRRIGFNGRPFRIYKFRSMTTLEDGALVRQAQRDDDRVTRVGRLLRRFSLDELPQLLNVLRGEMSLVGPRPHALAHDDKYIQLIASYAMRQKMKPGITGLAQVSGCRGETPHVDLMKRRVEMDLRYIDGWSLWLDIRILAITVLHVVKSRQAY